MKRLFFLIITSVIILVSAVNYASPMGSRAKGPKYNLLLVTIDILRADHLGCYGYNKVKTPVIDGLAKEGAAAILLENERRAEAFTQSGLNWLEKNKDAPFFLWLHYLDPHAIYLPPNPFKEEYKR